MIEKSQNKNNIESKIKKPISKFSYPLVGQCIKHIGFAFNKTFVICVKTQNWHIRQLDSKGKMIKQYSIKSNNQPKFCMYNEQQVCLLYKQHQCYTINLWNMRYNTMQTMIIKETCKQSKLIHFQSSGIICCVFPHSSNSFRIIYCRKTQQRTFKIFHVYNHDASQKKTLEKCIQLDEHSLLGFFTEKAGISEISFQTYNLKGESNYGQLNKYTFKHIFVQQQAELIDRKLRDIWLIDKTVFYLQICQTFKANKNQKETIKKQNNANGIKVNDCFWNFKTDKIQMLNTSKLKTINHRFQFIESLRQIQTQQDQTLDVIYYYHFGFHKIMGICGEKNDKLSKYIWQPHMPNIFAYISFNQQKMLSVFVWKLSIPFQFCFNLYAVFFMMSIEEDCDQDLLDEITKILPVPQEITITFCK